MYEGMEAPDPETASEQYRNFPLRFHSSVNSFLQKKSVQPQMSVSYAFLLILITTANYHAPKSLTLN